jgi:integrase
MKLYELVDAYKASHQFTELAPRSQMLYQQMITSVYEAGWRNDDVNSIAPLDADTEFPIWVSKYGRSKAIMMTKVMKRIWNYGYRSGAIKQNPWSKMGIKGEPPRTTVWDKETLLMILGSTHNEELKMLVSLLYATGQRPSDVLSWTKDTIHFSPVPLDPYLQFTQKKTGNTLRITIPRDLASCLYALGSFSPEFKRNYHNVWASLKAKLNDRRLDALQLRDLRRTVLTEMATGGATDVQIRAVSGHSTQSAVPETVYIQRDAQQASDGLNRRSVVHGEYPYDYLDD